MYLVVIKVIIIGGFAVFGFVSVSFRVAIKVAIIVTIRVGIVVSLLIIAGFRRG